ncbi:MAG: hypothetical protein R2824_08280 [Saprospiraceae bacterium]
MTVAASLPPTDTIPTFTFTELGAYQIELEVYNDVCNGAFWRDSIEISEPPEVDLAPIAPIRSGTEFEVSVTFPNQDLVESVMWDIGDLDSRTGFDPGVISYPAGVTGRKTIMVTVTNRWRWILNLLIYWNPLQRMPSSILSHV